MLRRVRQELAGFPGLMRLGLVVLIVGGALDVVYHTAPQAWMGTLNFYLGYEGSRAHLVTFIGMAITLAGVLARSRRPVSRRPSHRQAAMRERAAPGERRC